jgi:hypothetical protein
MIPSSSPSVGGSGLRPRRTERARSHSPSRARVKAPPPSRSQTYRRRPQRLCRSGRTALLLSVHPPEGDSLHRAALVAQVRVRRQADRGPGRAQFVDWAVCRQRLRAAASRRWTLEEKAGSGQVDRNEPTASDPGPDLRTPTVFCCGRPAPPPLHKPFPTAAESDSQVCQANFSSLHHT